MLVFDNECGVRQSFDSNLLFLMVSHRTVTSKENWQDGHDNQAPISDGHTFGSRGYPGRSIDIFGNVFRDLGYDITSCFCHLDLSAQRRLSTAARKGFAASYKLKNQPRERMCYALALLTGSSNTNSESTKPASAARESRLVFTRNHRHVDIFLTKL